MTVSQVLSYAMALIEQMGLMPYIQGAIIIVLASIGLGAIISVLRKN